VMRAIKTERTWPLEKRKLSEQRLRHWCLRSVFPGRARTTVEFELRVSRVVCQVGKGKSTRQRTKTGLC
jgi:hypothetical protein